MNTTFEDVYKVFLNKIQDWKQRNLFLSNEVVAIDLCRSFLMKGIAKFITCQKPIGATPADATSFAFALDITEMDILTSLMVEAWLDRVIMDITQMNLTLTDNDFRHYSEEKNLEKKVEARDRLREINSQDMWNYDFKAIPWLDWSEGNYGI